MRESCPYEEGGRVGGREKGGRSALKPRARAMPGNLLALSKSVQVKAIKVFTDRHPYMHVSHIEANCAT